MGKKKDARIAQNEANMQVMQAKLQDDYVNARVQAGGEDQMSPEMQEILAANRNQVATSMGSGINMKSGCQVKKHMKSSGMNMTSKGDPIKKKSKKLDIYKTLGPVNAPINDGNYTLTSSGANFFNKKLEKANPKAYRENYLENEDKKFYQQMKKKQMKSSGMNMSSSSRHDSGGPKMAPLIGMAVKALAPMVMGKMADKLGEKSDK